MTPRIWDPVHETMTRDAMQKLQLERLQQQLRRLYDTVPFYRQMMRGAGVTPEQVRSPEALARLPLTTKQDLRDNYPFGLLAVAEEELSRMHVSGGTTGKPTLTMYTARDIATWTEMVARTLTCGGAAKPDKFQIAYTYGLFTAGLGFHYGAERIGATVIPASSGQIKRQVMLIQDLGTTVLCGTASYALFLADTAVEMGIDLRESRLRLGFFGAEPWTEKDRAVIEERLNITAVDAYGLSEILGPGVAGECPSKAGLHIQEDHFLPEVVDPATGRPLPEGERGELVLTTLTREALPVIRYRTGDVTSLASGRCDCGRTLIRMERVSGRTDDMIVVRGINVFPSQIEAVLLRFDGIEPKCQIVVDRKREMDDLEIRVEVSRDAFSEFSGEIRRLELVERAIREEIESLYGLAARVKLVEPGSLH